MKQEIRCAALSVKPGVELYHVGPPLDLGPLPTVFYFALSGQDSLCLDPFNQPVQFLLGQGIRVFSLTLPAHEAGFSPQEALKIWAEETVRGVDFLAPFLEKVQMSVEFAIQEKFVDPNHLAAAGLSRGGLAAAFVAAADERFRFLLGLAPITKLALTQDFQHLQHHPLVQSYDTNTLASRLADRQVRLYIGNKDTKVSTRSCVEFAMKLVEEAPHIRSPQIELIMSPSIGRMGHGTSPEIFQQGALWLQERLKNG